MNQNNDDDRLSVGVARFVVMRGWFVIKWRGGQLFFAKKMEEEEEETRGGGQLFFAKKMEDEEEKGEGGSLVGS